ncbi:hypothetical protein shim_22270 [Shimia sp. SK013]|nr:hypothetical protein shim_22270 [Shimia sp. SK013]
MEVGVYGCAACANRGVEAKRPPRGGGSGASQSIALALVAASHRPLKKHVRIGVFVETLDWGPAAGFIKFDRLAEL